MEMEHPFLPHLVQLQGNFRLKLKLDRYETDPSTGLKPISPTHEQGLGLS